MALRWTEGFARFVAIAALAMGLAGCVSTGDSAATGAGGGVSAGGLTVVGDQAGGKIANGVSNTQTAMKLAQAHCAQFGRKTFITKMDAPSEGALMAFECRQP